MKIDKLNITPELSQKIKSVYFSNSFLALQKNATAWGIFNHNELVGWFLTATYKRLKFFNQLSTPLFTPSCELYFNNKATNPAKINSNNKKLIKLLADFLNTQPEQIISLSLPYWLVDTQPFIWKNFKVIPHYTYHINISICYEELLNNMSTQRRKNIIQAQKDGLVVKKVNKSEKSLQLIVNTYKKQNISIDESLIKQLIMDFSNEKNSICYEVYDKFESDLLATSVSLINNNSVDYILGGYNSENSHQGASALALWNTIIETKTKSIPIFNFNGSMQPQIETFFRGFGGELIPYYTLNKSNFLIETILKLKDKKHF